MTLHKRISYSLALISFALAIAACGDGTSTDPALESASRSLVPENAELAAPGELEAAFGRGIGQLVELTLRSRALLCF